MMGEKPLLQTEPSVMQSEMTRRRIETNSLTIDLQLVGGWWRLEIYIYRVTTTVIFIVDIDLVHLTVYLVKHTNVI